MRNWSELQEFYYWHYLLSTPAVKFTDFLSFVRHENSNERKFPLEGEIMFEKRGRGQGKATKIMRKLKEFLRLGSRRN